MRVAVLASGGVALAACQAAPTPTTAPVPTTAPTAAPKPTAAPAATTAPTAAAAAAPTTAPTAAPAAPTAAPAAPTVAPTSVAAAASPTAAAKPTAAAAAPTVAPTAAAAAPTVAPATAGKMPTFVPVKTGGDIRLPQGTASVINHINRGTDAGVMGNYFFGRLITYDVNGADIYPVLAESWQVSPDGRKITMKIKNGVKWHDGTPFTSKDMEFTIKAIVHKETASTTFGSAGLGGLIGAADFREGKSDKLAGVRAIDTQTFELEWEKPYGAMMFGVSLIIPLPEHLLGKVAYKDLRTHTFWEKPVALGPFKFSKHVADQFTEFVRFDDYVPGKANLDRVLLLIFKDIESQLLALEKGEVDWVLATGAGYDRAVKIPTVKPIGGLANVMQSFFVNLEKMPNKNIVKALYHAIDRPTIINTLYGKQMMLANSVVGSGVPWHNADIKLYEYSPDKAKALLKEANWDANRELDMLYYYADQTSANLMAALQQYFAAVGVKSKPRLETAAIIKELYEAPKYDIAYVGGPVFAPDPSALGDQYYSKNLWPAGGNGMKYKNLEVDKLLEMGETTFDPKVRYDAYKKMQTIVMEELPIVPLWEANRYVFVNNKLCNVNWSSHGGYQAAMAFTEKWGFCQ